MFLLNFDITIVIDFSHKRDFVETQTEKKVKFVLPHPLGEHVSMWKQRSGMNGYSCLQLVVISSSQSYFGVLYAYLYG